jgi:hypothetical protein
MSGELLHKRLSKENTITIIAVLFISVVVGLALFSGSIGTYVVNQPDENPVIPKNTIDPVNVGYTLGESAPVRLRIPKMQVDVPFVPLGLASNNEIEVPKGSDEAGWYVYGPTPGELGPAVVLGHVGAIGGGMGVFYYLGQLEPGDKIEIDREDGTTATFQVDKLERYLQSSFPTSLVYGNINYAGLRLITCSGSYDREQKRFDSNLIVFASLIEPE